MQPASISSRFSAMNLDWIIFGALWQAFSMFFNAFIPELMTQTNSLVLCFLASFFYFAYPTKKSGQTLGKKLLSLKVIPLAREKEALSWPQVFLREGVGKLLSLLPLCLGYAWAFTNPERKAWHDSLSRTQVVSLVWEEEKTTLQKLQNILLGILSIPLGVAMILGVILYTPLPLDSIKENIEASGIQVGALTGSLAMGLHFSEIKRQDKEQSFDLGSIDVKCNLPALVYERIFVIEKLTVEEGHIEVPENFSWATIFVNLMSNAGIQLGHFKMGKLHFKNIFFEHDKKSLLQLQDLTLKNLEMEDQELRINEAQFQTKGLTIKAQDFKASGGILEVGNLTGGLGPEFLPLLKAPVDFHFKGRIGKNPQDIKIEGGMTLDKIKFSYENQKLNVNTEKLLLNEMFKTALPLEEMDLRLSAQGDDFLKNPSSLNVEYGIKICGREFQPDVKNGPTYNRDDRQFSFKLLPKPIADLGKVLFAQDSTLDELFFYKLLGRKQLKPDFISSKEMVADLCYQRKFEELQASQLEVLTPFVKAVETLDSSADLVREAAREARSLLREGKYGEAKALLEAAPISSANFPAEELGAFYNLKAWVYLYLPQPKEALEAFEWAFNIRKDISDAEGLMKVNEILKKDQEVAKWLLYIQKAIQENPELKNHLTPNMQKKIENEKPVAL